jgi:hypothetical protein
MHIPDIPTPLLTVVGSLLASFLGAWLAAHFALRRFYREKTWERKLDAYSAIFGALHDMYRWFSVPRNLAIGGGKALPPAEEEKLKSEYEEARANLQRRLAVETWLIPPTIANRIEASLSDLSRADEIDDWLHYMHAGNRTIAILLDDLHPAVRADLGITNPGPLVHDSR